MSTHKIPQFWPSLTTTGTLGQPPGGPGSHWSQRLPFQLFRSSRETEVSCWGHINLGIYWMKARHILEETNIRVSTGRETGICVWNPGEEGKSLVREQGSFQSSNQKMFLALPSAAFENLTLVSCVPSSDSFFKNLNCYCYPDCHSSMTNNPFWSVFLVSTVLRSWFPLVSFSPVRLLCLISA